MFPLYNSVKATIKQAITLKMCIYFPHPQLQLRTSHSTIFSPLLRKVIKNIKKEIHSIFIKTYIIPLSQFLKISLSWTHYTHCIPVVQLNNSTILFLNMRGTIILCVMACTVVSFYTAPKILKQSCLKVTKNESLQYWQVLTVSWGLEINLVPHERSQKCLHYISFCSGGRRLEWKYNRLPWDFFTFLRYSRSSSSLVWFLPVPVQWILRFASGQVSKIRQFCSAVNNWKETRDGENWKESGYFDFP